MSVGGTAIAQQAVWRSQEPFVGLLPAGDSVQSIQQHRDGQTPNHYSVKLTGRRSIVSVQLVPSKLLNGLMGVDSASWSTSSRDSFRTRLV